jgi:ankyrin repeat protein
MEVLLKAGANPNALIFSRTTALHRAAYQGRLDLAETLLRYGADKNMLDQDGKRAVECVEYNMGSRKRPIINVHCHALRDLLK